MKTTKYILTLALTLCCALGNVYAINSSYYSSIDGKKDSGLREALTTLLYDKHTTGLSYDWDFDGIDWDNSGNIYDIYSDCGHKKTDETSSYQCCCDAINREHVVPQSTFDSKYPQYADRHHLYVVDGKVNGYRSNYAFGECSGGTKGTCKSSSTVKPSEGTQTCSNHEFGKLGTSTFTEVKISDKVYEPGDEYKGDIARAILYMAVRYATTDYCKVKSGSGSGSANAYPVTAWSASSNVGLMFSNSLSTNYGLSAYGKALLLKWHRNDPVSAKEIARNNGVEAKQGNRNPFVDYPCLVEYLWGNKAGETVSLSDLVGTFTGSWTTGDGCPCGDAPAITLPTGDIFVGSTEANQSVTKTITVQGVNLTGNLSLALSGTNSSLFSINATTMLKASAEAGSSLTITYSPTAAGNHTATLTISGGGLSSGQTFALSGTCCNPYVVTLSRNGITETVGACGTFTLPTAEDEVSACDGWEFKGWLASGTSFTEGTTTAPTFVTSVSGATTLHAVYGQTSGGGGASSATYLFTTKAWNATLSGASANWTSGKDGNGYSNNGVQVTTGYTGANATCPTSYSNVSSIVVSYCTNSSNGAGSITMNVGGTELTETVTKTGGTTARDLTFDFSSTKPTGAPKISVECTTNSVYVCGVTINSGSASTTTYKKLPCTTYTISYADADGVATGGSYQASATTALAGTIITLDYDEALGYEFTGWLVTQAGGASVTVTSNQFAMPEANVTVQANFAALCSKLATPNVTAVPGDGQITLTWQDVEGADHYTVNISKGAGYTTECGSVATIGTITGSAGTNTCVITGLTNGLEYTTSVVANSVSSICDSDADEDTVSPTDESPILSHDVTFTPSLTGATVTVNNESSSPQSVNYGETVTVVVTPAAHYTLSALTVRGGSGDVAVSGSGNTRTFIMPNEDVTVTVVMAEDSKYTVNWYVAGTPTAETNYVGEALAGVDEPEIECNGKVFAGWTATADYEHDTDAPSDLFTDASTKTMPSNNTNYYAVFATATTTSGGGGAAGWTATAITDLTSTDVFVIVGTNASGSYAMTNDNGTSSAPATSAVTIADSKISGTPADNIKWNISGNATNGYVFYPNGSTTTWLYCTNSNNGVRVGTNSYNTFTVDGGYLLHVGTSRYVGIYNSQDWRCYTSSTGNIANQTFAFYKYSSGGGSTTTYLGYTTTCSAPADVTVTFYANDGSASPETTTQVVGYNTPTALDANSFTRTDYAFEGWNTSADGSGTAYADEAEVTLTQDITLYAQWAAIYTIRFFDNSGVISSQSVIEGNSPTVPDNQDVTVCDGYTLAGWWTAELAEDNTTAYSWIQDFTVIQKQDYYAVYSRSETSGEGGEETIGWSKATSIAAGDKVVLVCESAEMEMTSISSTSTKYGIGTAYTSTPSGTFVLDVVAGTSAGTFAFKNGNNYLYWTSGNSLAVNGTLNANTSWNVSITDGNAEILNAADNTRQIWWNNSSPRFACYTDKTGVTGYNTTQLYKQTISGGSTTMYYSTSCNAVSAPADVMLTAQLNGNYYAMTDAFVGSTTEIPAQPYFYESETYYYKDAIPANITWRVATFRDSYYIMNAQGKYLTVDGESVSMGDEPFAWLKSNGGQFVTASGTGLCYNADRGTFVVNDADAYSSVETISPSVAEVAVEDVTWEQAQLYTRENLNQGYFATICLPFAVGRDFIEGVNAVYNIVSKVMTDGKLSSIALMPETGQLQAGRPYVIEAEKSADEDEKITLYAWYGEVSYPGTIGYATGLIGNLTEKKVNVPAGCYCLSKNQLRKVTAQSGSVTIGQYRAYFDLSEVVETSTIPVAMGCKVMTTADYDEVPTSIIDSSADQTSSINWDEPVYNVLGQRVDRSATGVLVQGGRKFIVDN